jgi:hypothetical protein
MPASAVPTAEAVTGAVERLRASDDSRDAPANPPDPMAIRPTNPAMALLAGSRRAAVATTPGADEPGSLEHGFHAAGELGGLSLETAMVTRHGNRFDAERSC